MARKGEGRIRPLAVADIPHAVPGRRIAAVCRLEPEGEEVIANAVDHAQHAPGGMGPRTRPRRAACRQSQSSRFASSQPRTRGSLATEARCPVGRVENQCHGERRAAAIREVSPGGAKTRSPPPRAQTREASVKAWGAPPSEGPGQSARPGHARSGPGGVRLKTSSSSSTTIRPEAGRASRGTAIRGRAPPHLRRRRSAS